jgi:hypothetical protein
MVFSIFLFLVLVFVRVYTSSVPPMTTFVDQIDKLVPDDKKREFTAGFFRDPKNLEILNEQVEEDFLRVQNALIYIWDTCLEITYTPPDPDPLEICNEKLGFYFICSVDDFKLENFVEELATYLKLYIDYQEKGYIIGGGKSIGEIVDTMIGSLKMLNPKNWNKEFFAKLRKAFKNEDYQKVDETENLDDTNDKNVDDNPFSDLPIATVVDEIDKLIPNDRKKNFIVKFFKDPKNLEILNKAVKNDFENVQSAFIEIWNTCFVFSCDAPCDESIIMEIRNERLGFYDECTEEFTLENYIRDLAAYLQIYNDFYKKGYIKENGKTIGEMVDPMIKSLKELNQENWDKEFFAKLQKAFNNEDYQSGENSENPDDAGNNNGGKDENQGKGEGNNDEKPDDTGNKDNSKKDEKQGKNGGNKDENPDDTCTKEDSKKDDNIDNGGGNNDEKNKSADDTSNKEGGIDKDVGNANGNTGNGLWYLLVILLILAVIGAVAFIFLRNKKQALPIA